MNLELSESDLTAIIKQALVHYQSKPFGGAVYVQTDKGVLVQFYDAGAAPDQDDNDDDEEQRRRRRREEEGEEIQRSLTPAAFPGTFGGFGGGSSGGGGASGGW